MKPTPKMIDELFAQLRRELESELDGDENPSTLYEWQCLFRDLLVDVRNADTNALLLAVAACHHWIEVTYHVELTGP